jgi:hypothetical protein
MKVDNQYIRRAFLKPETQYEVGTDGYDAGAKILTDFFAKELEKFDTPELHPMGREIIQLFRNNGTVNDYIDIIPMRF